MADVAVILEKLKNWAPGEDPWPMCELIHGWRPGLKSLILPDYGGGLDESVRLVPVVNGRLATWEVGSGQVSPDYFGAQATVKHPDVAYETTGRSGSPGFALAMAVIHFCSVNDIYS